MSRGTWPNLHTMVRIERQVVLPVWSRPSLKFPERASSFGSTGTLMCGNQVKRESKNLFGKCRAREYVSLVIPLILLITGPTHHDGFPSCASVVHDVGTVLPVGAVYSAGAA